MKMELHGGKPASNLHNDLDSSKFEILVDPFLVIITIHLVCLNQSIKEDFKRNNAFSL